MILRDYQSRCVEQVMQDEEATCIVSPTGSGKTTIASAIASHYPRVCWVAHRIELIDQARERLRLMAPNTDATVVTIQSLRETETDLLVIDECFAPGTRIDGNRIENIKPGDCVNSYNHEKKIIEKKKVLAVFKNRPNSLVKINDLICTPSHPFFLKEKGSYIPALKLCCGMMLTTIKEGYSGKTQTERIYVQKVWKKICSLLYENILLMGMRKKTTNRNEMFQLREDFPCGQANTKRLSENRPSVLFKGMYAKISIWNKQPNNVSNESKIWIRANEEKKSNEQSGDERENKNLSSADGLEAKNPRWKRKTNTFATENIIKHSLLADGSCCYYERAKGWLSNQLQNRYCKRNFKNRNRSGWPLSSFFIEKKPGYKEDFILGKQRVENIKVFQQTSDGTFGGMCPDGYVYNIEVEGNNNYFANGILVHNCTHYAADDWQKITSMVKHRRLIGLTATPERGDGRSLAGLFTRMVVAATYSELLAAGPICPCTVYAAEPDRRGLSMDPLEAWIKYGNERLTMAYASSVDDAKRFCQAFQDRGIASAVILGETDSMDRKVDLWSFAAGKIRVLWNVYCLTEGLDVPETGCILLARPCNHPGTYIQITGRGLRPFPGKDRCRLIDLVGAWKLHGMPTEDRVYSLTGKPIRRDKVQKLRQCLKCGAVCVAWVGKCPNCGYVTAHKELPIRIYSDELFEVYDGGKTPEDAKALELARIRRYQLANGKSLGFTMFQYKRLFGKNPVITDATGEEKAGVLAGLRKVAGARGFKPGWIGMRYKAVFGEWPRM
mgnify:CR=1 FL=1